MGQKWGRPVAALMWIVLFLAGSGSAQAQGTSREDATAGPSAASFISILWGLFLLEVGVVESAADEEHA